jgi:predicted dehydrogenase
LASRDDVSVSAVCDIDAARAEQVAALSGAQVFSDWRKWTDHADGGVTGQRLRSATMRG